MAVEPIKLSPDDATMNKASSKSFWSSPLGIAIVGGVVLGTCLTAPKA